MTRNASGRAIGERHLQKMRRVGAQEFLHHEGRVGAEHHHLAVGHVDDAHDAEGDGEADGGEQQHRAERQPVPDVLDVADEAQAVLDGGDRGGGELLRLGVRLAG